MTPRINYVITTWSGERRLRVMDWALLNEDPRQVADLQRPRFHMADHPMGYIRAQLKYLEWCEPKYITQITIMNNINPDAPDEYEEFLRALPNDIRGIPVVVINRPNNGYSFGGFSHAYGTYRTAFTHYWFTEDDYWPVQKEFDRIAFDIMTEKDAHNATNGKPPVGWLCMFAAPWSWPVNGVQVTKDHAAGPHGLAKAEACEVTWRRQGRLSHKDRLIPIDPRTGQPCTYSELCIDGQVMFSWDFVDSGYGVEDWRQLYACYFAHENGQIGWSPTSTGSVQPLIMPANGVFGGFPWGGLSGTPTHFKKPEWPILVDPYPYAAGLVSLPLLVDSGHGVPLID